MLLAFQVCSCTYVYCNLYFGIDALSYTSHVTVLRFHAAIAMYVTFNTYLCTLAAELQASRI